MDTAATPNLGQDSHAPETPEQMEITEQVSTYRAFNGLVKWGSLALAVGLLFLTMLFCTKAGFFPSAIVSVLVLALGLFGLRGKAPADPAHSPA